MLKSKAETHVDREEEKRGTRRPWDGDGACLREPNPTTRCIVREAEGGRGRVGGRAAEKHPVHACVPPLACANLSEVVRTTNKGIARNGLVAHESS